jgi:RIO kinase 1
MPKLDLNRFDEHYEEYREPDNSRNLSPRRPRPMEKTIAAQAEGAGSFEFSYQASRHERVWIVDYLGGFYESHWIQDVMRLVKGGKEANVYQCLAGVGSHQKRYLAAKVYRPRQFRNLKKDHLYREGRPELDADGNIIQDHKTLHTLQKRTAYGEGLRHSSWIEHEHRALVKLHAAGADVPEPYARGENAILMSYIGGKETPAPALNDLELERDEAQELFERTLRNIEIMLAQEYIHGDLSAYNILYWRGKITLIDFPQVVRPAENRNAYRIFERDVTRVCEYFARQRVRTNPHRLAADLWTSHNYRLSPEIHPRLLDDENPADRTYWRRQSEE